MVDESRKPKICTEMLLLALMQRLKCAASRFVAVQFESIDRHLLENFLTPFET